MEGVRLPQYIRPILYNLDIKFDFNTPEIFQGNLRLMISITQPTKEVFIHAQENHNIEEVLIKGNSVPFQQTRIPDVMVISLPEDVTGEIELKFTWTGTIKQKGGNSFYHGQFRGDDTYSTQFEPVYGRQVLPCFDEPCFKAKFVLSVSINKPEYTVLSNTLTTDMERSGEWKKYNFGETPYMSLYLLHWTIMKNPLIEGKTPSGIPVRIYNHPSLIDKSQVFLDLAVNCLDFYEKYFGIAFPLPKQDLIAVYGLSFRAMENWGAITFKENILTKQPNEAYEDFTRNMRTVCHEMSHMWFGNLVTMEWWTDIWLNEGFARFMEHKALNIFHPEFKIWDKFLPDVLCLALQVDSGLKSHPIEVNCKTPDEINVIFDTISYAKGASVIRMLEDLMGQENFEQGVRDYLDKYKWQNTVTCQLWECLNPHSSIDIESIMSCWVFQKGHPLLTVSSAEGGFSITQRRFLTQDTEDPEQLMNGAKWIVPIRYSTEDAKEELIIMDSEEFLIPSTSPWIKLNSNFKGVYRVAYSEQLFDSLIEQSKQKSFNNQDAFNILSDALTLWKTNNSPYSTSAIVRLIRSLAGNTDYIILSTIFEWVKLVWFRYNAKESKAMHQMVEEVFMPAWNLYSDENVSGDYDADSILWMAVNTLGSRLQIPSVIEKVCDWFQNKHSNLGNNLKKIVANIAARYLPDKTPFHAVKSERLAKSIIKSGDVDLIRQEYISNPTVASVSRNRNNLITYYLPQTIDALLQVHSHYKATCTEKELNSRRMLKCVACVLEMNRRFITSERDFWELLTILEAYEQLPIITEMIDKVKKSYKENSARGEKIQAFANLEV